MAKPFIAAYHAGATSVSSFITTEQLIYWYRPNPRGLNCDATDTTMVPANNASGNYFEGHPDGWQDMADSIFVIALLQQPGTITIMSGANVQTFNAPAGATSYAVDMQVGQQQFFLTRNGQTVLSAVSLKDVTDVCVCGIYNFNAYVGTVPDGPPDPLPRDGLASLTAGLHVSTCSAMPSLGTVPIKPIVTPPVGGGGGGGPPASTTSSIAIAKTTTAAPPPPLTTATASPSSVCIGGVGQGNYIGLCSFCCNYGYCPPGPCKCTASGAPIPTPPTTGANGIPLPGEDNSYLGLCSFACNHGYCPPTACTTT
jgi:hypothetical protein